MRPVAETQKHKSIWTAPHVRDVLKEGRGTAGPPGCPKLKQPIQTEITPGVAGERAISLTNDTN